ncbi:MAG: hypothetical protein AAF316_10560 [Cyanobacteria bacterium P01_A01_bin.80]
MLGFVPQPNLRIFGFLGLTEQYCHRYFINHTFWRSPLFELF